MENKNKLKHIFKAGLTVSAILTAAFVLTAASTPKTTGDSGWINISAPNASQAHTVFNAMNTSAAPGARGAKGSFLYDDGTNIYSMDVKWLKVDGKTARFAGPVTLNSAGCCAVGHWIFIKIEDNGEPGIGVDRIWGEDLGEIDDTVALAKVEAGPDPIGGPFVINSGNLQVKQ